MKDLNEKNTKDNIVLIGMPAVGKSTVGVILAKIMGYQFVDADIVIQKSENRLLREIIEQDGVDGFIAIENKINASLDCHKTIIATGGSVVYGEEAMEHLKSIGKVVYLRVGYDTLNSRLGSLKGRGVVLREGQTLVDIFNERTPLYEKYADIIVDEEKSNVEETIAKIIEKIENER